MAAKEDKFTWKIEKFSTLEVSKIHSPTFSLKGHQWHFTLQEMSEKVPRTKAQLLKIDGIGPSRLSKYGDRLLQTIESTIKEYYREDESGSKGNNISDSSKNTTIDPPEAIVYLSTEPLSTENQEPGISKDAGDHPEVIELDAYDQFGWDSASPPLSNKVARTSTIMSPSSNVRSASKNLIAELSTMASSWKSTSVDDAQKSTNGANMDSALLQEQRGKLAEYFEMSLEAICRANLFDKVNEVVLKISDLATDPFEKRVLKDLLSRLVEFRSSTPKSISIVESPPMVETPSPAETRKQLEGNLVQRKKQLTFLDAKALRIEEEKMKVEAEIRQLVARKDKLVREEKSVLAELDVANREASREVEGLKRKQREHEHARKNRLRAKERLARNNVSWKLFKDNLGL
ncbi:ATP-dependent DNA helicase Q-like 4A [Linum perenne]